MSKTIRAGRKEIRPAGTCGISFAAGAVLALLLLALAAAPCRAETRQNLLEYITANLRQDGGLPPAEQARIVAAVRNRFADYALKVVPAKDTIAADVVLRMIIEGVFDQSPEGRIADVAFAAWQAMSRGAPPDVVEGIALYGYRKKIGGEVISAWASGYKNLTDAKVPPEVAADLIRNAMEKDWDIRTFDLFKQNMYAAAKARFNMRDYATYLFGTYLAGKKLPGATAADAMAYFKKCALAKTAPKLPEYQGVFTRKPFENIVYEAKPKEEPVPAQPEPQAVQPPATPVETTPEPVKPAVEPAQPAAPVQAEPVQPAEPVKPAAPVKPVSTPKPAPAPTSTPAQMGLAMGALWPGLFVSAQSYLGTPYVWGGTTHKGIDCSAFTQNSYGENKVGIPRVSRQQWKTGDPIEWKDLQKGDLVFFNTMGVGVSHVGLVVDPVGPKFVHASSSHGVMQADLGKNYYKTRYLGARRIVP